MNNILKDKSNRTNDHKNHINQKYEQKAYYMSCGLRKHPNEALDKGFKRRVEVHK
jgi:hypothetical protein